MFPSLDNVFDHLSEDLRNAFVPQVDYDGATLIDTYQYSIGEENYEQKVYRLKNHSICVEIENLADTKNKESLQRRLTRAIKMQNFELAASLRDKIKTLD